MFRSTSTARPRSNDLRLIAALVAAAIALSLSAGCGNIAAQGKNAEGARLFQQGDYQAALRQFQEATQDDPTNADAYYNLASTYHRLGTAQKQQSYLDQARNLYNQCLDRQPNHRDCYRGLAVLLAEQGRTEEAFRLVETWVDRQPQSADAKIELARLFEEYGDRKAAREHLLEALTVEPDNSRALAALGKIREDMGERSEALKNYQRALAQDNRQPQLAARVASLQSALGPTSPVTLPASVPTLPDGLGPQVSPGMIAAPGDTLKIGAPSTPSTPPGGDPTRMADRPATLPR